MKQNVRDFLLECKKCKCQFVTAEALVLHSRAKHGGLPKSHLKRNALLLLIIIVIAFASYNLLNVSTRSSSREAPTLGPAPDFALTDIDGKIFSLRDLRGKIVLMHLVVPNCPSCAAQNVELRKIASNYGPDMLSILSVSIDPNESDLTLQDWGKKYQITWTIARDTVGLVVKLRITDSSTLFILDEDGAIRFRHEGVTSSEIISQELQIVLR